MTASNWVICPRCINRANEEAKAAREAVMATYGKVPVAEFDAARAALEQPNPDDFETFREDYKFYGATEDAVTASYSGGCSVCGLSCMFEHVQRFWP